MNEISFTPEEDPGDTIRMGNIVGILDSTSPLVSRLMITSNPSLPTADVVCLVDEDNDTRPYFNNKSSKLYIIIVAL